MEHPSDVEEYWSINDAFYDCPRSFSALQASVSMQNQSESRTVLTETGSGGMNIMEHACEDARRVLLAAECSAGTLPSTPTESFIVISGPWSEPTRACAGNRARAVRRERGQAPA